MAKITKEAYIKILDKRIEKRKKKLKKLSKRKYNPFSYQDYNAYYTQKEIEFIKNIISELT